MNIRTLPSWRQKEGAHTEILLYEKENEKQSHTEPEETDGRRQSSNLTKQCIFVI